MTMSAMSGDGLRLDNGVVMWFDTIEYLGIHFRCGKGLQVDTDPVSYTHLTLPTNREV